MNASPWQGIIGHTAILNLLDRWLRQPAAGYVFFGVSHLGKHTVAERCVRILLDQQADSLGQPHPDLLVLEAEEGKTTISVERVRELRGRVAERPLLASRRVVYIPRADRLNEEGLSALLKVLEEPPAHAVFLFVTEFLARLPATIQSRIVKVPFRRVPFADIASALQKQGRSPQEAEQRARIARGRPGLALVPLENHLLLRSLGETFFQTANLGERLSVLETLTKQCETQEDAAETWNEALEIWSEMAHDYFLKQPIPALVLSQGVIAARRFVGGALSPRFPLEAVAIKMEQMKYFSVTEVDDFISRLMPQMVSSPISRLFLPSEALVAPRS